MPRSTGCGLPTISGWWFRWSRWRNRRHPAIKSKSTQEESHSCVLFSCVFGGADCAGSAVRVKGQPNPEADPLSDVFHRAGASVGCDSGLYNGKAQPVPPLSRLRERSPRKKGSQRWGEILSGDGKPIIADRKAGPAGLPGSGQGESHRQWGSGAGRWRGDSPPLPGAVPGRR